MAAKGLFLIAAHDTIPPRKIEPRILKKYLGRLAASKRTRNQEMFAGEDKKDLPRKIKAITFDAYGTLVRLDNPFDRLVRQLKRFGLRVPHDIAKQVFMTEMTYYREHHVEGKTPEHLLSLRRRCADLLFQGLDTAGYPSRFSADQKLEVLMGAIRFRLFADVPPILEWCASKGLATGVISNWDFSLKTILEELFASHPFKCVIISAVEGMTKSDPGLFLKAAKCLSLDPSQVIHVGDEVDSDFDGARAAGFTPVLLDRTGEAKSPPVLRIRTLADFPNIYEQIQNSAF
jgi:FMN phosphatase YigB (HAD superfamily)